MSTPEARFLSHAQNGEDVVLWRALGSIEAGTYVDIGANHPSIDSVTRAFYDHGWSGLLAEPSPEFAGLLRDERPRDIVAETVVTDSSGPIILHMVEGTGLSTIVDGIGSDHAARGTRIIDLEVDSIPLSDLLSEQGFDDRPIHFLSIDTEGAEASVLRSLDFTLHRPWVLVIEATAPTTTRQVHAEWEPQVLAAGYEFCLFDGLSRFYVAREHLDLAPLLSYPHCVFDDYETMEEVRCRERAAVVETEIVEAHRLVREAVADRDRITAELAEAQNELVRLRAEYTATVHSVSWRVTTPLRAVRRRFPHHGRAR